MKVLCSALLVLCVAFLHSATADETDCPTHEEMMENMDEMIEVTLRMEKENKLNRFCWDYMMTSKENFMEEMEKKLDQLKKDEKKEEMKKEKVEQMKNEENKEAIKVCLQETYKEINEQLTHPASEECMKKMLEKCPLQKA